MLELWKGEEKEWKRFNELRGCIKEITPKVLSERLKELEAEGLIMNRVDASSFPVKSEYQLTEAGSELIELVTKVKYWALKWKIDNEFCFNQNCRVCEF